MDSGGHSEFVAVEVIDGGHVQRKEAASICTD